MKKAFLVLLVLSLVIMGVACVSAPAAAPAAAPAQNSSLPPWMNETPPEDVLWGTGSAQTADFEMSRETATQRGRVAIVRTLTSKVDAMFTDYTQTAGGAALSFQQNVSRNVSSLNLTGARAVRTWVNEANGTVWVLVEYKKSDAHNTVASMLNNEEAQYAEFKASQALQMLDAQLAKNDPLVPVTSN